MGAINDHDAGWKHSDFEEKAGSFKAVHQRILLDAKTTDGTHQVRLDTSQMAKKVRAYVRSLLSGRKPMDDIMEQSYIHKNGFQKIVLGRKKRFLPCAFTAICRVRATRTSTITDGREWTRWSWREASKPTTSYTATLRTTGQKKWERHDYRKAGDDYIVNHQGETYLVPDERVHHPKGELYSMDAKRLHRLLPATEPVATLVVTHPVPKERVWCNLYQKRVIEELEPVHEIRLTRQQMVASPLAP